MPIGDPRDDILYPTLTLIIDSYIFTGRRTMACSKAKYDTEISSDSVKEIWCAACKSDGETNLAVKYCLDCQEYICQHCVDSHRRIKLIKKHKLVDHMSKDTPKLAEFFSCNMNCPTHCDKQIEFE